MIDLRKHIDPETMKKMRNLATSSTYFMAKAVLGFNKFVPHIHLPVSQMLDDPKVKRARLILPRGWYKSTEATVAHSIKESCRDPNIRILIVQNSASNARKKLSIIRAQWESNALLRALFPELVPDETCVWTADNACLKRPKANAEATYECAGTRTKVVSRHYDLIIEDDTVSPDLDDMTSDTLLPSQEDVEQAIGFHRNVLPLLVDIKESRIILVGTRWFPQDLLSWNKENEPHYASIERAVREIDGIPDENGEITYPERFDESVLDELRKGMGEYLYTCLYMNKPISSKGMVFQPEWMRTYEQPPRDLAVYTTVDLASDPESVKGDPDWNVVMTCGKDLSSGRIYVLEYFREQCSPSKVVQAIFDHVRRYQPLRVGVEAVGYQANMLTWVRERMRADGLYFLVEPLRKHRGNKVSRISALEPFFRNGLILLRTHHNVLRTELLSIARDRGCLSKNDDVADALSMQLQLWALTRSAAEQEEEDRSKDPLSFEVAEKELETRIQERFYGHLVSSY